MAKIRKVVAFAALGLTAELLVGCGTQSVQASQYMSVPANHTVDLKVVAGFSDSLSSNTIDGAPSGQLVIAIPVGTEVHMHFINKGPMPESVGIYRNDTQLAFAHSGDSYTNVSLNAASGVAPGASQTYTFTASRIGTFTLSDLLDGSTTNNIPNSNIWETVKVIPSGKPSFTTNPSPSNS